MLLRTISLVISLTLAFGAAVITSDEVAAATECDYYASPNGGGNGFSHGSPFKIADFWSVAGAGKTLCLLDGVYTDSSSMIAPPQNLNGTAFARITIKALNDGKVRINGGGVRKPVTMKDNDWFILEGFDVHNCAIACIHLYTGADNNIVRRVIGWDAGPDNGNSEIFGTHVNTGNLFEDVAGFGKARKIYQNSQGGNNVKIRRAWGRYEFNTQEATNPNMTYSIAYNSYNAIYENVIGTWDEQPGIIGARYGIFATDRLDGPNFCANSRFLGFIAYMPNGATLGGSWIGAMRSSNKVDCLEFKDTVTFLGSNHSSRGSVSLININPSFTGYSPALAHFYKNGTEIGGSGAIVGSDWTVTNRVTGPTVNDVPNIWNGAGSKGARVCKRYNNGVLTNEPLWPWPMNQRIIDAMKSAGKNTVDVTKTMEEIFGTIPRECRSDSTLPVGVAPVSPTNLAIR
jgi:hypothetical protein